MTDSITPVGDASHPERKKGLGRIAQFSREVVNELRKVVTPTRKELITYTTVVLVFVAIMMLLITGLDVIIGVGAGFLFGNGTTGTGN